MASFQKVWHSDLLAASLGWMRTTQIIPRHFLL